MNLFLNLTGRPIFLMKIKGGKLVIIHTWKKLVASIEISWNSYKDVPDLRATEIAHGIPCCTAPSEDELGMKLPEKLPEDYEGIIVPRDVYLRMSEEYFHQFSYKILAPHYINDTGTLAESSGGVDYFYFLNSQKFI